MIFPSLSGSLLPKIGALTNPCVNASSTVVSTFKTRSRSGGVLYLFFSTRFKRMIKLHGLMRQPVFRLSRITAHTSAPATPSMRRSISTTAQQCQAVVQNLTVSELYKTLREEHFNDPFRKNLRLIDTRERHEIESFGRIESAVNLPYGLLKKEDPIFSAALEDFDKNVKVSKCLWKEKKISSRHFSHSTSHF